MADTPRRRLADRVSSSPTLIGTGSRFTGDLECDSDLMVSGTVIGDGDVRGALTLSDGGRWQGEIRAGNAVIAGEIQGSVSVAEKLELRASARIKGSLRARTIAVAKGAIIDGDMAVTSGSPVMHFEEKRNT
ncbi:MAG TPA: polymer-forming cytoskeletal protein [Steroidobacter sp.]|uniref:bactofilin family protein n=1 Tax=Steroidobacter sp. TaxID=1978227 RepID=UPI002EDA46C5